MTEEAFYLIWWNGNECLFVEQDNERVKTSPAWVYEWFPLTSGDIGSILNTIGEYSHLNCSDPHSFSVSGKHTYIGINENVDPVLFSLSTGLEISKWPIKTC